MSEHQIKYSNVWEDAELLSKALEVNHADDVLSIASGGDNSLFLASFKPRSLTCVDTNEVQIFLTQLKEEAIRHLDYQRFLDLLGFQDSENRMSLFNSIKAHLASNCRAFFEQNPFLISLGIIHQGKFEKYFQRFASSVLPLVHSRKEVKQLFKPKSAEDQLLFYNKTWNSWRWRFLFRLFFSRFVMGRLGREPEKLKEVEGSVGRQVFNMAEEHLVTETSQTNYLLYYALHGHFGSFLPPYAREEAFNGIKEWLSNNRISYHLGFLDDCLRKSSPFSKMNLSNIFEYMAIEDFQANRSVVLEQTAPGARISYWNLLVPRLFDARGFKEVEIEGDDLGFFYSRFCTYQRTDD